MRPAAGDGVAKGGHRRQGGYVRPGRARWGRTRARGRRRSGASVAAAAARGRARVRPASLPTATRAGLPADGGDGHAASQPAREGRGRRREATELDPPVNAGFGLGSSRSSGELDSSLMEAGVPGGGEEDDLVHAREEVGGVARLWWCRASHGHGGRGRTRTGARVCRAPFAPLVWGCRGRQECEV